MHGTAAQLGKIAGVRAGLIHDVFSAHQSVEDDDMNVLCLGGKFIGSGLALELIETFLHALVVSHWGTTPGQNFIYVHLNRAIRKYDLDMFYVAGPVHGGPAIVGNVYLEGTRFTKAANSATP
jgi:phosphoketolase